MSLDDVFGWGALALFLGPIAAALAIPVFRWLMQDVLRILVLALAIGAGYWWAYQA